MAPISGKHHPAPSQGVRNRDTDLSRYPVLLAAGKPVPGEPGSFRTDGVGRTQANPTALTDVVFAPFYSTHRRIYGIYWPLATPADWFARLEMPDERRRTREADTLAYVQPGQMESERRFNYQSSVDRAVVTIEGRSGRGGPGWFSLDLPVNAGRPMTLIATYHSGGQGSVGFRITVDGATVATHPTRPLGEGFYDVEYSVGADVARGKQSVTVRFEATANASIAPVFGVRLIRAEAESSPGTQRAAIAATPRLPVERRLGWRYTVGRPNNRLRQGIGHEIRIPSSARRAGAHDAADLPV